MTYVILALLLVVIVGQWTAIGYLRNIAEYTKQINNRLHEEE